MGIIVAGGEVKPYDTINVILPAEHTVHLNELRLAQEYRFIKTLHNIHLDQFHFIFAIPFSHNTIQPDFFQYATNNSRVIGS